MMELASDVGPVPLQVGAVLVFESGAHLAVSGVRDALAGRVCGIPRLRQQLVSTPPGCGRPVWVDDPEFDITRHVHGVRCPPPGDEAALLRVAAGAVTGPLPPGQPLWSATLVTGLAGDACPDRGVPSRAGRWDGRAGDPGQPRRRCGQPCGKGLPEAEALLAPACPGRGRQQAPYSRAPLGRPSPAAGRSC
jgi:hypothetical protein